jgi:hypothetical protein
MENLTSKCNHCFCNIRYPEASEGRVIKCPKCSKETKLVSNAINTTPAKMPITINQSELNIEPPTDNNLDGKTNYKDFPQRMKASKALEGTPCSICGINVDLGDDIINCKTCHTSIMHLACYEKNESCGNIGCENSLEKIKPIKAAEKVETNSTEEMKDCEYCGEKIKAQSKKCRYCGEYLDRKLKILNDQKKRNATEDEKLEISEIIFCSLCGALACIVSIVYLIQGKKKGWKMLGISFLSFLFWSFIRGVSQ